MKKILLVFFMAYSSIILAVDIDSENIVINKAEIIEGELFLLELEAINPLDKTVQGGITVSFSSDVEVKENEDIQSGKIKIYPIGSEVFGAGHKCCVKTERLMVEKWYKEWPANSKQKMILEFSVQDTDSLKIFARAAFIEDLKKKKVINIPKDFDQQEYLAYDLTHIKSVSVKKSVKPEIKQNVKYMSTASSTIEQELPKPDLSKDELPPYLSKEDRNESSIDKSFRTRLITGMSYFSHKSPFITTKYSDYTPFIGIGLSATFDKFSIDGYVQRNDYSVDHMFKSSEAIDESPRFRRTDQAITLGYKIEKFTDWISKDSEFSVFTGYKWSKTEINNIQINLGGQRISETDIESSAKGPFVGLGYIFNIDEKSNKKLGFYYSYGRFEPNYSYTISGLNFPFAGDIDFKNEDYFESHKFGIYFNGVITRFSSFFGSKLTYRILLDKYQYTMDPGEDRIGGSQDYIEEEVYNISAAISWTFD
ncbi:MAG: hypothetical protein QM487_04350 [Candidatus Marithrix sp.]